MKLIFLKKFIDNNVKLFRRTLSYPCVGDLVEITLIQSPDEEVIDRVFGASFQKYCVGIVVELFVLEEIGKYNKDCAAVLVNDKVLNFDVQFYKFKVIK